MRGILLAAMGAGMWYVGGFYRVPVLVAAAFALLALFPIMGAQLLYQKLCARIVLRPERFPVRRGQGASCFLQTEKGNLLPFTALRSKGSCGYQRDKPSASPSWSMETPYCGMIEFTAEKVTVSDSLRLLRCRIGRNISYQIPVLPLAEPLAVYPAGEKDRQRILELENPPRTGSPRDQGEFQQLREYAAGDDYRAIHWNQSARLDQILVKEFLPEENTWTELFLDLQGSAADAVAVSSFYQVVYSLILGLLSVEDRVLVRWQTASGGEQELRAESGRDADILMMKLYQAEHEFYPGKAAETEGFSLGLVHGKGLRLDLDLRLFSGGRLIQVFAAEDFQRDGPMPAVCL